MVPITDIDILNDAYNAAPESLGVALHNSIARGRRSAVIGGMRELGRTTPRASGCRFDIETLVLTAFSRGRTEATRDALGG